MKTSAPERKQPASPRPAATATDVQRVRLDTQERPTGFQQLLDDTRIERKNVRNLVKSGHWKRADPEVDRVKAFTERVVQKAATRGAEAIVGNTNDLQGASFLAEGAIVRRAIGYVEVNDARASNMGSGFLISPRLFLTNFHVVRDAAAARSAHVVFDRETGYDGRPLATTTFLLDPNAFAVFSPVDELDFALVAVGQRNSGEGSLQEFGYCPLANTPDRHVLGMGVNIIQHPNGWPKMVSVRNNLLTARSSRTLVYETDTEEGASGAPVFNDIWDVVALHHWGQPYLERVDEDGNRIPGHVNEGIRISAIYTYLQAKLATLPAAQRGLLEEALSLHERTAAASGPVLRGPRPRAGRPESVVRTDRQPTDLADMNDTNELRLTIPLEVTVRLGDAPVASNGLAHANGNGHGNGPVRELSRMLTRGAEAKKLDRDYTNRIGYQEDHIPGHTIRLPKPKAGGIAEGQIAPLRSTEPKADGGELLYEHFSVFMHKTKRMALFTATNIDGETYLEVDRDTGLVRPGQEGETWYKDPRISESFWTGQDFYSAWSTYFDRGHLTRRTDPTWGNARSAERANADTFHFTNCATQHFRFNQTTPYWQGAERYILENGVLANDERKQITVFQGPIFDDAIDLYADDLQIPSSFFKVIVWEGANGLKAVGLMVDQLTLLSEPRANLGQPRNVPAVNVSQWRVAIGKIEERSGLDFSKKVRDADTIDEIRQPGWVPKPRCA